MKYLYLIIIILVLFSCSTYDQQQPFYNGMAIVQKGDFYGAINEDKKLVADLVYDSLIPYEYIAFGKGYTWANALKNNKWGYIDNAGKEVIPFIYDNSFDFSYNIPVTLYFNLAFVQRNNLVGIVDLNGTEIIPCEYDSILRPNIFQISPPIPAKKGDYWGYLDTTNQVLLPFKYQAANHFKNGEAYVKDDTGWCYIDTKGALSRIRE